MVLHLIVTLQLSKLLVQCPVLGANNKLAQINAFIGHIVV